MLKRKKIITKVLLYLFGLTFFIFPAHAESLTSKLLTGDNQLILEIKETKQIFFLATKTKTRTYLGLNNDKKTNDLILQYFSDKKIDSAKVKKIIYSLSTKDKDTDKDGLTDVLEDFLGTNKNQADTNKNSYSDLVEIKNNYDPVSKGKLIVYQPKVELKSVCTQPSLIYEGKIYETVSIGKQCWLKQNLNIGLEIIGSVNQINSAQTEKYCYNDQEENCTSDGGLYQWSEAMNLPAYCNNYDCSKLIKEKHQGLCPPGWHIPTDKEWKVLEDFLGTGKLCLTNAKSKTGCSTVGTKLKIGGMAGFKAGLSGYHTSQAEYKDLGEDTYFWSTDQINLIEVWQRQLSKNILGIIKDKISKKSGATVRCVAN